MSGEEDYMFYAVVDDIAGHEGFYRKLDFNDINYVNPSADIKTDQIHNRRAARRELHIWGQQC